MTSAAAGIAVVVAVKNGERFLAEALDSLAAQTLLAAEVVLVDGASSDGTRDVAQRYAFVRIVEQRGTGVADAYNVGVDSTTAPLVAFLSSDDRWRPDKLARQAARLASDPRLGFVVGWAAFFLEAGMTPPPGLRPGLIGTSRAAFIMETLLVRRTTLTSVGPFDATLRSAEDVDWFSRARDLGVAAEVVAEAITEKRVHDRNTSLDAGANTARLLRVLRASAARKSGCARGAES